MTRASKNRFRAENEDKYVARFVTREAYKGLPVSRKISRNQNLSEKALSSQVFSWRQGTGFEWKDLRFCLSSICEALTRLSVSLKKKNPYWFTYYLFSNKRINKRAWSDLIDSDGSLLFSKQPYHQLFNFNSKVRKSFIYSEHFLDMDKCFENFFFTSFKQNVNHSTMWQLYWHYIPMKFILYHCPFTCELTSHWSYLTQSDS